MRIIAGEYRGRVLRTLPGLALRPTSDRLRETLFNILGSAVRESVFIDGYAGSGAIGLEALSRGAAHVYAIESSEQAARLIEGNAAALGVHDRFTPVKLHVEAGLRKLAKNGVRADFCFLDPPYRALQEGLDILNWLSRSKLIAADGLIILEHSRRDATPEVSNAWSRTRLLQQGSAALSFYRRGGGEESEVRSQEPE